MRMTTVGLDRDNKAKKNMLSGVSEESLWFTSVRRKKTSIFLNK